MGWTEPGQPDQGHCQPRALWPMRTGKAASQMPNPKAKGLMQQPDKEHRCNGKRKARCTRQTGSSKLKAAPTSRGKRAGRGKSSGKKASSTGARLQRQVDSSAERGWATSGCKASGKESGVPFLLGAVRQRQSPCSSRDLVWPNQPTSPLPNPGGNPTTS